MFFVVGFLFSCVMLTIKYYNQQITLNDPKQLKFERFKNEENYLTKFSLKNIISQIYTKVNFSIFPNQGPNSHCRM